MLFSIIIPTYNAAATLTETLNSISGQTFKDVEVIIVDNCSVDSTNSIVEEFSKNIIVQFISEEDSGIYEAMNKGVEFAKGDWLYFIGSDDVLFDKNVLGTIARGIEDNTDILYGDSIWVPENKCEQGEWSYQKLLHQSINHQRIFYKRSLFKKWGGFNTRYRIAADYELNIRYFCNPQVNHQHLQTIVAYYHSGGYSANKIDEIFWEDWRDTILGNFKNSLSKKIIYLRLSGYCWRNLSQRKIKKSAGLCFIIFLNTFSFSFLKHTLSETRKIFKRKAFNSRAT